MELILCGHEDRYAVEQLCLSLFPQGTEGKAVSALHRGKTWLTAVTTITIGEKCEKNIRRLRASTETVPLRRQLLQQSFYLAALPHLQKVPAWGALAGVRPTKLTTRMLLQGLSPEEAAKKMEKDYFVTPERAKLAVDCSLSTKAFTEKLTPNDISLYVGIPFCPTRCAYCSFVSADVQRALKLVEPYLAALDQEIDAAAGYLREAGAKVRTIYIGGGTPTTLSAPQLEHLIAHLRQVLELDRLAEFTVEAGRPDTITADKMAVLRDLGVDRVSVNPQTMQDEVLRAMGRSHTAADILTAYDIVRKSGIPIVNMDLIAGLPKDSVAGFQDTLDTVLSLDPENITVHTLALKKGARLMMEREGLPTGEETSAMLDYAWDALRAAGQIPYYLYRQKYMSGALENIGWCKPGTEGLYNICIMEELHSILALGAGGSTKLTNPATGKVVRLTNPKYPQQYMERIDQLCRDKAELVAFQRSL